MFVTFVHCDQTVGRFKMKLRMQIDLGPSHIVLDGDLAPLPKKGVEPPISANFFVAKWLDASRCRLVWR